VYEETLTGRPLDTSGQKATSDNKNVDAVNVMPWTSLGVDAVQCHAQDGNQSEYCKQIIYIYIYILITIEVSK